VGENQIGVRVDAFQLGQVDFADYKAIKSAYPEFSAALMGHVFAENYKAVQISPLRQALARFHEGSRGGFEIREQSPFKLYWKVRTKKGRCARQWRYAVYYTTVTYDILWKSGVPGGPADTVDTITKTKNRKPGVP
jgi:hypothetical protein